MKRTSNGGYARRELRTAAAISSVLATSVVAIYVQTRHFEFLNLDDYNLLVHRPIVSDGITSQGLWWALSSVEVDWRPLTWLSHMLDFSVFGSDPGPQHLVSAGIHAANGVLLFLALRALTRDLWPSALAAALFALHPLRVESVAWLSERKDVLSGLFWMLTLLAYAAYGRRPSKGRYALVGAAFVAGLMSKTMVVSLPFVLLMLDVWPLGRLRSPREALLGAVRRYSAVAVRESGRSRFLLGALAVEKLPLLAMSAAAAGITVFAQQGMDAVRSRDELPIAWRIINVPLAYCTYLYQTLWPARLAAFYPHPGMISGTRIDDYLWPAAAATVLLATITVVCVAAAERRPYFLVGWLWYLVTLLPVIGVLQVGEQSHADRFTYLPMIGVYVMAASGLHDAISHRPALRVPAVVSSALVLVILAAASWRQIGTWQNSRRLFEHAIAVTDRNYFAHQTLGNALVDTGDFEPAQRHLEEALRIRPASAYALEQLGALLEQRGDRRAAADLYEKALRLGWNSFYARLHLAAIRRDEGNLDAAIELWTAELRNEPDNAQIRVDLGTALLQQRQYAEAIIHLRHLVELAPNAPEAHNALGVALAKGGQLEEAAVQFEQTLALSPGQPDATRNLQWVRAQGQVRDVGRQSSIP